MEYEGLEFYRCMTCGGIVNVWDIKTGGCIKCGGTRIRPSNLTLWEKIVQIIKHPKIWRWSAEGVALLPQGRNDASDIHR